MGYHGSGTGGGGGGGSKTLYLESTADYGAFYSRASITTLAETNTSVFNDVFPEGTSGLRVPEFVLPANYAGGDLALTGTDRTGAAQSETVAAAGLGGATVYSSKVWTTLNVRNTVAGSNAGRVIAIQFRSVVCSAHAPVSSFVAVWDNVLGKQTTSAENLTHGWVEIDDQLASSYRLQYKVVI